LIIDLNLRGKTVLLVGGGQEAERKIRNLTDECATLIVVSRTLSESVKRLKRKSKNLRLYELEAQPGSGLVCRFRPDVLMAATDDRELNASLVREAREMRILSYAADDPSISDFKALAIARKGDLRIAFYTGGKSPAVSSMLRKRVERLVTKRDLRQIRLQEFARSIAKRKIPDSETRKRVLYSIMGSRRVRRLLDSERIEDARAIAVGLIERHGRKSGS